ncbi:MAG: CotH kinase family protein [Bacteroidaceae bacterium]|nr:CotH kinase family protein [Bacteroidaceae bacterium]
MKTRFSFLYIIFLGCIFDVFADTPIEDGVYYISNATQDGYLGLGKYHDVDPYIYYVTDGQDKTADAYWVITNTRSGYTFCNEATGELLVFTSDRVDQYYKYMTLASEAPEDHSQFWNIIEGADGAFCIQSTIATEYYWNLRNGTNMMGTYSGSNGTNWNERYVFHKKEDKPDPGTEPDPEARPSFPEALHVYLSDGRLEAYPLNLVKNYAERDGKLVIETTFNWDYTYDLSKVDSVSKRTPTDFPTFESFKFNNNFNDQVFTTANGEIVGDTVFVTIAAIGKRLTPSFKVTGEEVEAYVDEKLQTSKETRLRFDKDIYYILAWKGCKILTPEADGKYFMKPYGRVIRVHVDWLTDRAEVPTIYINTSDGQPITSKEYFKDAEITIDGHGIFPSMETTAVQIKGRGNSSWGWAKKPYRLKFPESVKPLGMTKGKNWVLLANGIGGSLMTNAVGMKAANLMEASAANHIVPVDIYLNGEYRGSYNLTEKVGFANNSVDLDDETAAALLELDSYYDEPEGQKFRSTPYNLPINIKEPEFAEGTTSLTLEMIQNDFNAFMQTLNKEKDITRYVDIMQLSRFLMVNELICNFELYHPKSTFCYRESFESDTSKYIFGPVWDLDWGFGYEQGRNYFKANTTSNFWIDMPNFEVKQFLQDLRWNYEPMCELYKKLWKKFLDEDLEELKEYCQDYYDFACNSFNLNRDKWGDRTDYAQQAMDAASWLDTRANKIYQDILDDVRPEKPEPPELVEFDNNKLYNISCRRGELILSYDYMGLAAGQKAWWTVYDYEKQFAIINIEGNNYLYSPYLKKYLRTGTTDNGEWVEALGSPIYFDTSNADGEYLYMISTLAETGSILWFNNNTSTIVINSWNTPDDGDRWMITEAGEFDPTEALEIAQASMLAVTTNLIFDGEVIASETKKLPYGADMPEPPSDWANAFVMLEPVGTHPYMVTGETTVAYEAVWVGPFEFITSAEDAKWYNMTIRSDYMVGKTETEPYYPVTVQNVDTLAMLTFQWAFSGNPYKVKVYNRSTGLSEVLTPDGQNAVMRKGSYEWELLPNKDGFVLRVPGTSNKCINQFGGKSGPLGFWDSGSSLTDNGSTFRIVEAPDPDRITPLFAGKTDGAVYDLSGRKVADGKLSIGKLPKGIYIINGTKIAVK